jgi:tetratricopeptide (TPR) repeat protein
MKLEKKAIITMMLLVAISCRLFAQSTVDSIQESLLLATTDREKLNICIQQGQKLYNSNPIAALEYGQVGQELAEKLKLDSLVVTAQYVQANALLHLGNYSQALDLYLSMIKYGEKRADSTTLLVAYGNIGNIYYFQRDYERALKNYLQSLQYFPNRDDKKQLLRKANLLSNIGTIYDETTQFAKAEKFYKEALDLGQKLGNAEVIGNVLNNTGTLYRDQGNDSLALIYYRQAYSVRISNNNILGMARSCYSLGLYHFTHHAMDSAVHFLKRSIELGKQIGSLETVSSSAEIFYKANKALGKNKEALEAFELFRETSDSLFNEKNTKRILQLEMQFQFDKKQSQLEGEQKEKELYYLIGVCLLLLLFLTVTILFLLQKNKTKKSLLKEATLQLEQIQLRNDLEKKDKELATNVTFLLSKNELINQVSEKLLKIKQSIPAESQATLQKVILDIQSNLQPELWQEFEFRFQQVYDDFYKTLTVRFPDLSPSERRLCAFLKLNMTTKEISALTHQNAKSIDVARTRLRKKLGLTGSDQNLVTFLEQLDASADQNGVSV